MTKTNSEATPAGLEKHTTIDPEGLTRATAVGGEALNKAIIRLREYASLLDVDVFADDNEPNLHEDIELVCTAAAAPPASPLRGVSDERAFNLSQRIHVKKLTIEEGAIEIMHYATDAIEAEREHTAAASPLRGREWQSIKTAPKDGSTIEVRYVSDDPRCVRWSQSRSGTGWHLTDAFSGTIIEFEPTEWRSASPPETEIELLAYKLAGAELDYRIAYEKCGGDSINTGRAWDKMRLAGDAIRKYEPPDQDSSALMPPMLADIAQIIDAGWKSGKSAAEVAAEILREFAAAPDKEAEADRWMKASQP